MTLTARSTVAQPAIQSLSDREFDRLRKIAESRLGIRLPSSKKLMFQARLLKRLRQLGMSQFSAYCDLLGGPGSQAEMTHFLNLVTTNKTSFFRESEHFDFMTKVALPEMVSQMRPGGLRLWSAACSTGEEPYTIAMVVAHFFGPSAQSWNFRVLATDVSTRVLQVAKLGIYPSENADSVPVAWRQSFLMRSTHDGPSQVRIVPELRSRILLRQLNFMDPEYRIGEQQDLIMCRNVLIYFERDRQEEIVRKLCRCLRPGGFFVGGMSESFHGFDLPLQPIGRSIYRMEGS